MKHVFLDSSVLLSFLSSTTGASALILKHCRERKLKGHISHKVIVEVRKNAKQKLGIKAVMRFEYILSEKFLTINPTPSQKAVEECMAVINAKDAPILAASLENSRIDYLLTLDKKDFLKPEVADFASYLKIMTPGEFVKTQGLT